MEAKKNPRHDVHRYSKQLFLLSLGISIALVIVAFEWTTEFIQKDPPNSHRTENETLVLTYIPITAQIPDVPKPAKTVRSINMVRIAESTDEPTDSDEIPIEEPAIAQPGVTVVIPEIEPEDVPDVPFRVVEQMPEPVGGYDEFFKVLRNNIRYPKAAIRNSVEGKVFIQFVVNEKGELTDFEVIKSLGRGCDEEAIRVIKLTRWNPGKQRGRPVKVYMIQPAYFALH